MRYNPTSASAIDFANAGRTEEWVHLFLSNEGDNKPFSDGLKLFPRRYYAPEMMKLDKFKRCCGPEPDMMFQVPEASFKEHVDGIAEYYSGGAWDMPPLIIYHVDNGYVLSDGNHRFEALRQLGIDEYWVIIWETV